MLSASRSDRATRRASRRIGAKLGRFGDGGTAVRQQHPFLARCLGRHADELVFQILQDYSQQPMPHLRIEGRSDRKCPFCHLEKQTEADLLRHCRRFHGDHHSFETTRNEHGNNVVVAKPSPSLGLSNVEHGSTYSFVRYHGRGRSSSSSSRKSTRQPCKPLPYSQDAITKSVRRASSKKKASQPSSHSSSSPKRQYFHSRSRLPMQPGDWDIDSDDESDNEWLDDLGQAGLNEFVDITEDEKIFLDLWKRFIRSDSIVADDVIPQKCLDFVRQHIHELVSLRQQLLMHLTTLWEHRLVSSDHILICMKEFDDLLPVDTTKGIRKEDI